VEIAWISNAMPLLTGSDLNLIEAGRALSLSALSSREDDDHDQ
jgi:hypothetical protein